MTEELKKGAKWPPQKNPVTYMVDRNRVADQIRKIKEVQHEECYPVCSEEEKSEHIMTTCEKCGKEFPEWQGVEDAGTKKIVCEDLSNVSDPKSGGYHEHFKIFSCEFIFPGEGSQLSSKNFNLRETE